MRVVRILAAILLVAAIPRSLVAGGGPQNVLLVVNPNSAASMTIANHYIALRNVPPQNVLYLPWDPAQGKTDVDTFRQEILAPVLKAAVASRAPRRIDYVVYSSDFPTAVSTRPDVKEFLERSKQEQENQQQPETNGDGDEAEAKKTAKSPPWPKQLTQVASINGLTYLWQLALTRNPTTYMAMNANRYVRKPEDDGELASLGFRSTQFFTPEGKTVEPDEAKQAYRNLVAALAPKSADSGEPRKLPGPGYMLSTVLGVTADRGNSVPAIVSYLRRSAEADGTHPSGTIYYVKNGNIRSRARDPQFAAAVEQLEEAGVAAKVVDGTVPGNRPDVQGVMLGTASFDWADSESRILPGAICDHLTSFGGVMSSRHNQTTLAEFLRHGAAGASGTVTEPYAIQAKFPLPWIHVHYAHGCSLAEAFYQSVAAPYQLLIVGDPLCRPWADIPSMKIEGLKSGATVTGMIELEPKATSPGSAAVHHVELHVDGALVSACTPGNQLRVDSRRLCDGFHEARVVAVDDSPVQSQGELVLPFRTANHDRQISVTGLNGEELPSDAPLTLRCESPGSIGIAIMQNTRLIGRIAGRSGDVEIELSKLGNGPIRLHAVGLGSGGPETNVISEPLEFSVEGVGQN